MVDSVKKYVKFDKKVWIIGFGSIGRAILPLLIRHIDMRSEQISIITKDNDGVSIANAQGVSYEVCAVTPENYQSLLASRVRTGDFLLNLSVDVSSHDLIQWCQENGVLYLDTCIEPWTGGYIDNRLSSSERANYSLREAVLTLKKAQNKVGPTAVVTHGMNPGLVSHFVKQALVNMAADQGLTIERPTTSHGWAMLAHQLNIKAIHIAERDTQRSSIAKQKNEFVNTWSVDGFISEGCQPAELGWGTHERQLPPDGHHHGFGSECAIYLNRPGGATKVRTWAPLAGSFHGFLITHNESISIAEYLTLKVDDQVIYRPTVHYAYHPCEDAVLSMHELAGKEWQEQTKKRVLLDEITDGIDELGVLLMGNERGAYWFGSHLSIQEARALAPFNSATSLQVASGVLSGVIWTMAHPAAGIVEPDDMDDQFVLNIARPYLGTLSGHYTDWTPLENRETLFNEAVDRKDPWQFSNILVN